MTESLSRQAGADASPPWWPVLAVGLLALATRHRPRPVPVSLDGPSTAGLEGPARDASVPANPAVDAKTPADIPLRGWKEILARVYKEIDDDRIMAVAAGVTFYALLAIFPAIAAFLSLYGLFADIGTISGQLNALSGVLPGGAIDIIGEQVKRIAEKPNTSLSFAFVSGLLVALWSANAGMKAMFDALNVAYGEKERRGFVALNLRSLAFTVGAIVILMLALASVVVVPVVLGFFGLSGVGPTLLALGRWPILLAVIVLALSVLYRYGPSRAGARWRWITWGSGFAASAWLAASILFSIYVSRFGSYNATYGSLGAAIGFMTWIWISSIILLLGAEISAEMETQTGAGAPAADDRHPAA